MNRGDNRNIERSILSPRFVLGLQLLREIDPARKRVSCKENDANSFLLSLLGTLLPSLALTRGTPLPFRGPFDLSQPKRRRERHRHSHRSRSSTLLYPPLYFHYPAATGARSRPETKRRRPQPAAGQTRYRSQAHTHAYTHAPVIAITGHVMCVQRERERERERTCARKRDNVKQEGKRSGHRSRFD